MILELPATHGVEGAGSRVGDAAPDLKMGGGGHEE